MGRWPETTETTRRNVFSSWVSGDRGLDLQEGQLPEGHPQREKMCRPYQIA